MSDNGDLARKDNPVVTEEEVPSGMQSKAAVPEADKEGAKVSGARGVLQDHPGKVLAALIVLLAVVLGTGYFIRNTFLFEGTDDAQVDGHIMPLSARINGYVLEVPVIEGQLVHAGDVVVTIDPKDFETAMHQAQATLADSLASAASSRFNVPISSVTTQSNLDSAGTAVENAQAGLKAAEQNFASAKAILGQAEANSTKSDSDLVRYGQLVAKEERLVGRHRLDHLDGERLGVGPLQLGDKPGEIEQAVLARDRHQPAFDQIVLFRSQHEAGTDFQHLAQEIVIGRGHGLAPRNMRATLGAI